MWHFVISRAVSPTPYFVKDSDVPMEILGAIPNSIPIEFPENNQVDCSCRVEWN